VPHDIDVVGAVRCNLRGICKEGLVVTHENGRIEALTAVCGSRKVDIRVGFTGRVVSTIHPDDIYLVVRAEANGREMLAARGDIIHDDVLGSTQSTVVLTPKEEYDKYRKKKGKYPFHKTRIPAR
jgi:hypothetical protein